MLKGICFPLPLILKMIEVFDNNYKYISGKSTFFEIMNLFKFKSPSNIILKSCRQPVTKTNKSIIYVSLEVYRSLLRAFQISLQVLCTAVVRLIM